MAITKRVCCRCREPKPLNKTYFPKKLNGLGYECRICNRQRVHLHLKGTDYLKEYNKRRRQEARHLIIGALGGKCWCCGEKREVFLAIDHIKGGGNDERKKLGTRGSLAFLQHVVRQGIPKGKYRILCHNCNASVSILGYCPHHPIRTKQPTSLQLSKQRIVSIDRAA